MSIEPSAEAGFKRLRLHPSVSQWVGPDGLDPRQKVAAVAKVRCLERDLFESGRVRRGLEECAIEDLLGRINELRSVLGWLELDVDGQVGRAHLQRIASHS